MDGLQAVYDFFASFGVQSFIIPLLAVGAVLGLKVIGKEKSSIVKEDFAVGVDISFAAFVAMYVYFISLTHQLAIENDQIQRSELGSRNIATSHRLIIMGAAIIGVATLVRLFGWKSSTELHWLGIILPIAFGAILLWFVYVWAGAKL